MRGMWEHSVVRWTAVFVLCLLACAQEPQPIQIEKVVTKLTFTEGPAWSHEGFLYFTDIPTDRILKFTPGKGLETFRENSNGANGIAIDTQGRIYVCEGHARRVTRTDRKGKIEVVAERYEGKRLNSPNDVAIRKDFNIYFTDPAFGSSNDKRELDFYGVYRITPKGVLEVVAKPKGRPNGIALSPAGHVLYVSNSDERNIRAYDLDRGARRRTKGCWCPESRAFRTVCAWMRRGACIWRRKTFSFIRRMENRSKESKCRSRRRI